MQGCSVYIEYVSPAYDEDGATIDDISSSGSGSSGSGSSGSGSGSKKERKRQRKREKALQERRRREEREGRPAVILRHAPGDGETECFFNSE
jgi:hypothetical protein